MAALIYIFHTIVGLLLPVASYSKDLKGNSFYAEERLCACREEIAGLCIALLEEPAALNTTFEIKSTVSFSEPYKGSDLGGPAERNWGDLLQSAKLDTKTTGKPGSEASQQENASFSSAAI